MSLVFTQYMLPDGRNTSVEADISPTDQPKADQLTDAGWRFEIEILRNGDVHGDCCNADGQLSAFVCPNDVTVKHAVALLINRAWDAWDKFGKPEAAGFVFPDNVESAP